MKRVDGESFADYRARRKNNAARIKAYLAGRVIWPSAIFGTALKQMIDDKPHYVNGRYRVCLV